MSCSYGVGEGIRTLVSVTSTGFQDQPRMTTWVHLQIIGDG